MNSGVYSTKTFAERSNTENYWRDIIAKEIAHAKNVQEAIDIILGKHYDYQQ